MEKHRHVPDLLGSDGAVATDVIVTTARTRLSSQEWLVGGGEMARVMRRRELVRDAARSDGILAPECAHHGQPGPGFELADLAGVGPRPRGRFTTTGNWPICGAKHPTSMGQDFRECWASAFPVIGEAYASAANGVSHLQRCG